PACFAAIEHAHLIDVQEVAFWRKILLDQWKLLFPNLVRLCLRGAGRDLIVVDGGAMVVANAQPRALLNPASRKQTNRGHLVGPQEVEMRVCDRREIAALLVDCPLGLVAHCERRALAPHHVHQANLFNLYVVYPYLALFSFEYAEVQLDAVGIPTVERRGHLPPVGG